MANIFAATGLVLTYNHLRVLDGVSLSIEDRDRIGLVGRNGSGKSSFLKIIAGELEPDAGSLAFRRELLVGYLPQESRLDPALTVRDNIQAGASHVLELIHRFETLPADTEQHAHLEEHLHRLDAWRLDQRIDTAMTQLNCPAADRAIDSLSGGERRRVALCRAIVAQPDLLLLDEPTNHLDIESIHWLGDFLESYPGALLLVTHDRYFLDRLTTTIVELANGRLNSYSGNYTEYLLARAERQQSEELVEHKRQMFLQRELEWVRRGPQARTTKSKARLDRYFDVAGRATPEIEKDVDLVLPPPPPLGNRTVELQRVHMELGGKTLFSDLSFSFAAGQRIGVTGRNGLGKTTLLKIILGDLPPAAGEVQIGALTRFNYVDQGRLQLNPEQTPIEAVGAGAETLAFGEQRLSVRAYLKRFLFADDRLTTQVKHLSGGERSRLLLASVLKNGGNFLILDEPTNDLDLATLRVLEETLLAFPGVVVVVSHDRYFLNRVCTGILAFEGNGCVRSSVGNYDYYLEKRQRAEAQAGSERSALPSKRAGAPPVSHKPRRLTFKEIRELEGIEETITAAETDVARLEALFCDPEFHRKEGSRTKELTDELARAKERLTHLYARWEELEALRAKSASA